jgi:hypothetical protein
VVVLYCFTDRPDDNMDKQMISGINSTTDPLGFQQHSTYTHQYISKDFRCMIYLRYLYGCKIWSLVLREKQSEGVLGRIFEPNRYKLIGSWRELHNEEFHNFHFLPSTMRIIKSRKIGLAGHVARMGEKRNSYRILVGKLEGKRPLRRLRHRRVDNIKLDLREI